MRTPVREVVLLALLVVVFAVMNAPGNLVFTVVRWGSSALLFLLGVEWLLRSDASVRNAVAAGAVLLVPFAYSLLVTPFAFGVRSHLMYVFVGVAFVAAGLGGAVLMLADEDRPYAVFFWLNVCWLAFNGALLAVELRSGDISRFTGLYMNPNRLSLVTLILASFLAINADSYTGVRRYVVWALVACSAGLIATTLSLKGVVGFGLVVAAAVLKRGSKRQIGAAALLGAVALVAVLVVPNPIGARAETFVALLSAPEQLPHTSSAYERYTFIVAGFEVAQRFPFTGVGFQSSLYFNPLRLTYFHSNVVEVLVSLGAVGFLLYYVPLLAVLAKLARNVLDADVDHHELTFYFAAMLAIKLVLDTVVVSYPLFEFSFLLGLCVYGAFRSFDDTSDRDQVDPLSYGGL